MKRIHESGNANPSRIIGIQFGIMSPEEIEKMSVVEIVSKDTVTNNGTLALGGLSDARMGVSKQGVYCPTDGLTYIDGPGYFGHIHLAKPVFFIQYIKDIIKVAGCVCNKCGKLLINKEDNKHVLLMSPEQRWAFIGTANKKSKSKRCGELTENGCGFKQPTTIKNDGFATIIATWATLRTEDAKPYVLNMTPELIYKLFSRISDEDVFFMGLNPKWSRPEWMICKVLPIAPPAVRPSVETDAQQRSEDDLTHIYVNIIKHNNLLKDKIYFQTLQGDDKTRDKIIRNISKHVIVDKDN